MTWQNYFKDLPANHNSPAYRRDTPAYHQPTTPEPAGCYAARREVGRYSGREIAGINTLHKSNLVPVSRTEAKSPVKTNPKNQ